MLCLTIDAGFEGSDHCNNKNYITRYCMYLFCNVASPATFTTRMNHILLFKYINFGLRRKRVQRNWNFDGSTICRVIYIVECLLLVIYTCSPFTNVFHCCNSYPLITI